MSQTRHYLTVTPPRVSVSDGRPKKGHQLLHGDFGGQQRHRLHGVHTSEVPLQKSHRIVQPPNSLFISSSAVARRGHHRSIPAPLPRPYVEVNPQEAKIHLLIG